MYKRQAIFYARGVLETVKKLRWCPDVIHCHGWMTALAPLYIKKAYKDEMCIRDSLYGWLKDVASPQQAYWLCLPCFLFILYYGVAGYKIDVYKRQALHLPGDKGLLNLLKKQGYTVEPVL